MENLKMKKPANTAAVLRANAALLARGGRRMPGGYLQPDAAKALNELIEAGYAPSPLAVIVAAIFDARRKIDRNACATMKNVHNGENSTAAQSLPDSRKTGPPLMDGRR